MKRNLFLVIISVMFLGTALAEDIYKYPDYEKFSEKYPQRFKNTAQNVLAPAYPYLAEYLVDRYSLKDKSGIGIDIGGGSGNVVLELVKKTEKFYWISTDINTYFFEIICKNAAEQSLAHRLGIVFADAHCLPFKDNYADIVVSRGSFWIWKNKELAFSEIYRVLKPGGTAFIGRGFTDNMPLKVARQIREKQGKKSLNYDPDETAKELAAIMEKLGIENYKIHRPKSEQKEVSYGVWVEFSKSGN